MPISPNFVLMNNILHIIGDIGVSVFSTDVTSWLNEVNGDIVVKIDSYGGDLDEGYKIYEALKNYSKGTVTTIGLSSVASIATLIFLAGDIRRVSENTLFFVHLPMFEQLEPVNSKDLKNAIRELEYLNDWLSGIISRETTISADRALALLEQETSLTPEMLENYGFITGKAVKAVAKLTINKNEMSKKQEQDAVSVLNRIKRFFDGEKVTNKLLYTADNKEVEVNGVDEDEIVKVGDTLTVDGQRPEQAEITLQDGRVIKQENGVITEIVEVSVDEDLQAENDELKEEIEKLKSENEELKAEVSALEDSKTTVTNKLDEALKTIDDVKKIGSKIVNDAKAERKKQTKNEVKVNPLAAALKNRKNK